MGIFYERIEDDEKITITYRYLPLYYLFLIVAITVAFASNVIKGLGCFVMPVMLLVVLVLYMDLRKVNKETKKAMKSGKVTVSGSRWSFSNPMVVEIPKKYLEEGSQ